MILKKTGPTVVSKNRVEGVKYIENLNSKKKFMISLLWMMAYKIIQ